MGRISISSDTLKRNENDCPRVKRMELQCFIYFPHSFFHVHNHFVFNIKCVNHHDEFHRLLCICNSSISIEICLRYNLDNYIAMK